jgi:aspartyl-tRNA(Asn)/glutamyl-tRNA(Gln) amidotransferase subunit A
MKQLHELSITEVGRLLRGREISAVALVQHALKRIGDLDSIYHAFITVTADRALDDAARADRELAAGVDRGSLHGIPFGLKDIINSAGVGTTCGSRLMQDHVPRGDSIVAARMKAAGGVLLGKLMTYEFATVGPSFDLPFPAARNPQNPDHITGGSSSGSAVAVAAGYMRVAIGTDSGGSNRGPASYCGVVGLKPTYARISLDGIQPLSASLDHVGPLAATVAEAALCFDVLRDEGSPHAAADIGKSIEGLRIAYARSWSCDDANPDVQGALDCAAQQLSALGAIVTEIAVPDYDLYEACGSVIIQAEAFQVHRENLRAWPERYGRLAYQNLVTGAVLSADDYNNAKQLQIFLTSALQDYVFQRFDAVICASTLATAPAFSEFDGQFPRWTPMRTFPFNVTGHPALAMPIGQSLNGMPFGMQIAGAHFGEAMIFRIAAAYEAANPPRLRFPANTDATDTLINYSQ